MREIVGERIDDDVLQWFSHVEKMDNYRDAMRVYVGECAGNHSLGRLSQMWIDTVKDWLKKRDFISGKQGEWRMIGVHDGGL